MGSKKRSWAKDKWKVESEQVGQGCHLYLKLKGFIYLSQGFFHPYNWAHTDAADIVLS